MIKLNVDAGFDSNTRHAAPDFIARNHLGEVIFPGWSSDRLYYSAEEAEGLFGYGTKSSLATILSSASSSLALEIQGGVFGCMIQISLIYTSSCLVAWFTGVASPLPPCGE